MSANEFERYLMFAIKDYADEHIKAGDWNEEEAMRWQPKSIKDYYRKGRKQRIITYTIRNENQEEVGMIWLALRSSEKGFIYEININEDHRGHGYGKQAMQDIEKLAKSRGLKSIGLHVFGHNKVARGLYEKLGYIETNIVMEKKI